MGNQSSPITNVVLKSPSVWVSPWVGAVGPGAGPGNGPALGLAAFSAGLRLVSPSLSPSSWLGPSGPVLGRGMAQPSGSRPFLLACGWSFFLSRRWRSWRAAGEARPVSPRAALVGWPSVCQPCSLGWGGCFSAAADPDHHPYFGRSAGCSRLRVPPSGCVLTPRRGAMTPPRRGAGSSPCARSLRRLAGGLAVSLVLFLVVSALPRALILLGSCLSALPRVLLLCGGFATSPFGLQRLARWSAAGPVARCSPFLLGPQLPKFPALAVGQGRAVAAIMAALFFGYARRFRPPATHRCRRCGWESFRLTHPHGGHVTI